MPTPYGGYFIYNFCPSPTADYGLVGYEALLGTESIAQDSLSYLGQQSTLVSTPGHRPGEGVCTPVGVVPVTQQGSVSCRIWGTEGRLTVQAVLLSGQVLGSCQVTLTGDQWVPVCIEGLPFTLGQEIRLLCFTTYALEMQFWIDAIQYEPWASCHFPIFGDGQHEEWTGQHGCSASLRRYQFPVKASGSMVMDGTIALVQMGEIFPIGPITGMMDLSGRQHPMAAETESSRSVIPPAIDTGIDGQNWWISGGGAILDAGFLVVAPSPSFRDFAVFETGIDPDPAMSLIGWNNASTVNAASSATAYAQLFGTFSAPQQQLDSRGFARWQAAAYMAAGFRIASQPNYASGTAPGTVNFLDVQVEPARGASGQVPSAYQSPRSLNTIIKPTRLNYCPNPSMETSIAGWTAFGGASLSQLSGGLLTGSSFSLEVSVPNANAGAYIVISDLILGDVFIASAYAQPVTPNINDITMAISGASASSAAANTPYGSGQYGAGPYGGLASPATALSITGDYRPWASFTARESAVVLSFTPIAITGASYPLTFLIDCVLVEPGEVLESYGDGGFSGWGWELGGTPNLSRSYFYEREAIGVNAVQGVLSQHTPLGISAAAPVYFTPPSQ